MGVNNPDLHQIEVNKDGVIDSTLTLPKPLPDPFKYRPDKHKKEAIKKICDDGQFIRFISMFKANETYFYSLQMSHLGLPDSYSEPHLIYNHDHMKMLKGLPDIKRDGEVCKMVYDFEGLFAYLLKPSVEVNNKFAEASLIRLAEYHEAKNKCAGSLPRTRGFVGVPYRPKNQS